MVTDNNSVVEAVLTLVLFLPPLVRNPVRIYQTSSLLLGLSLGDLLESLCVLLIKDKSSGWMKP